MRTFDRLTILQAAIRIAAELEAPSGRTQARDYLGSPFPTGLSSGRDRAVERVRRRLYRAVQASELTCYRSDSSDKSTIYLRWDDIRAWHRRENPARRAVNG